VPPPLAVRARPDVRERRDALEKSELSAGSGKSGAASIPSRVLSEARAGWDAYQRGDVKAARTALAQAASHPAAPPWVHYTLGWTEFAQNNYAAAATAWERVRQAVAEFEAVYFDLADSYLQQREFGRAVAVLREAEKRWPQDVEVYNALGVVQLARGAFNDAVTTFEKAVSVGPDDAAASYNLARTLELRYIQSQRLREVSRSTPANAADRERAIEYYRRTVQIGKGFVEEAKQGLGRLGGL
jgi:tetratricopeptide (TPR) repeat protein